VIGQELATVGFRPMAHSDLPRLLGWLREPHVAKWWREEPADLAAVVATYGPCIDGSDPTELFVVEVAGDPIGMAQRYLLADEPDWATALAVADGVDVGGAAGIDYLIGEPSAVGRGRGAALVAGFTSLVFDWRPVPSIVVAVQQANRPSWRVLEASGYVRRWAGTLASNDPSDAGPAYIYAIERKLAS
jgi:aminoglycoside 6'-N-acetyltransferase